MKFFTISLLLLSLLANLTACGTLLHPERKGQTGGHIDPGVVVLDGIGLLFFFIPGVIAFAVDFSYGTIYLPGGRRSSIDNNQLESLTQHGQIDLEMLTSLVQKNAGNGIALSHQDLHITPLDTIERLPEEFISHPSSNLFLH